MKKVFILFCICVFLVGCDNKNKLEINLEGNPTTGYEWTYEIEDENVLIIDSTSYEVSNDELTESGGIYNYIFKSVNEGETSIIFQYSRSFEENSTIYKLTYKIKVEDEGKVSLVSKNGNYSSEEIPEPIIK